MDRYHEVTAKSGVTVNDAEVKAEAARILEKKREYETPEVYRFLPGSLTSSPTPPTLSLWP